MKTEAATPQPKNHQLNLFTNKFMFKDTLNKVIEKHSAKLESELRKVVQESVEQAFQRYSPQTISRPSESRQYKLQFEGMLPNRLFTGNKVEAEGPSPIKISLLDSITGNLVMDSPFSSKKVQLVALKGHFQAELLEDWTKVQFKEHMVLKRDQKRPLLIGKCCISLKDGVGYVDDVIFTDNSSWGRSKKFRLGAQLIEGEDQVREAVSSSFRVKDRRGETYQKHNNPSLEDDVWRLSGIAKAGKICQRLKDNQIYKVQDLVTLYHNDQSKLRNIMNVSQRKWKAITQQAITCISNEAFTSLSNIPENNIPVGTITINHSVRMPCLNLPQYYDPPSLHQAIVNDKQEHQTSEYNTGEHSNQLDRSICLDKYLVEPLLAGSSNDAHFSRHPDYPVTTSPNINRFDVETSMVEEGTNFFMGSSMYNFSHGGSSF